MASSVTRVSAPMWRSGGRVYRVTHPGHSAALYPSVTSVLGVLDKGALLPWAVRTSLDAVRTGLRERGTFDATVPDDSDWLDGLLKRAATAPDDVKNAAADIGTRVHAAIDAIVCGAPPPDDLAPDVAPAVEGFRRWFASSGLQLSPAGDFAVFSRTYRYAGAADCLGRAADGSLVVLDFKTSNSIHSSYALQLAAYAAAVKEMAADGELDVDAMLRQPTTSSAAKAIGVSATSQDTQTIDDAHVKVEPAMEALQPTPSRPRRAAANRKVRSAGSSASTLFGDGLIVDNALLGGILGEGGRLASTAAHANSEHRDDAFSGLTAIVVRLDKASGSVEVKRVVDLSRAFDAFKASLMLWHALHAAPLLE